MGDESDMVVNSCLEYQEGRVGLKRVWKVVPQVEQKEEMSGGKQWLFSLFLLLCSEVIMVMLLSLSKCVIQNTSPKYLSLRNSKHLTALENVGKGILY